MRTQTTRYVALLRGINVGGHHKVPMPELSQVLEKLGFSSIVTLLNSGNVIFSASSEGKDEISANIENQLLKTFGFPVPVILVSAGEIKRLIGSDPFKEVVVTPDTRLYVSFLKKKPAVDIHLPMVSLDGSFSVISISDSIIISVLDLSVSSTVKGMDMLEQLFGKDITTRNWNTIIKIAEKI
jgi:uncharacterized protein (DUF1697 family)